jgi:hypothetical protein
VGLNFKQSNSQIAAVLTLIKTCTFCSKLNIQYTDWETNRGDFLQCAQLCFPGDVKVKGREKLKIGLSVQSRVKTNTKCLSHIHMHTLISADFRSYASIQL